jgi:hypothetical protein
MNKKGFLYRNGLSIVFITLFLVTIVAQAVTGWKTHNNDLADEHAHALSFWQGKSKFRPHATDGIAY